jgi:hypothetical protein
MSRVLTITGKGRALASTCARSANGGRSSIGKTEMLGHEEQHPNPKHCAAWKTKAKRESATSAPSSLRSRAAMAFDPSFGVRSEGQSHLQAAVGSFCVQGRKSDAEKADALRDWHQRRQEVEAQSLQLTAIGNRVR